MDTEPIFEDDDILDDDSTDTSASKGALLAICANQTKGALKGLETKLQNYTINYLLHTDPLEESIKNASVIILECRIMEGFADLLVLRNIRTQRPLVPVIILSKNDDADFTIEAFSAGATDYISGELAPEILAAKVEVYFKISASAKIIELQNQEVIESLKNQRLAFEQKLSAEKAKAQMETEFEITRRTKEILDNLNEAFFTIEKNLHLGDTTSAAAEEIFGKKIGGLDIENAFPFLNKEQSLFFRLAIEQVFDGFMPLEVSLQNIPKRLDTANDKIIIFRFTPVLDDLGNIIRLIGCGDDVTLQLKNAEELERKIDTNTALVTILEDPRVFVGFLREVSNHLNNLALGELSKSQILFVLHTLKGNFSAYNLKEIAHTLHEIESQLREISSQDQCSKMAQKVSPQIRDMVVTFLTQFVSILKISPETFEVDYILVSEYDFGLLRQLMQMVQEEYIREKLEEWLTLLQFVTFERLISPIQVAAKQLAERQHKKVSFKIDGGKIKIDPKRFGGLLNSLIHAVRNSIDHGIELPEDREKVGKPKSGTITFSAQFLESNDFVIDIFDDGKGIDPEVILSKAIEKKLITPQDKNNYHDKKAFQLIFHEGFSTKDEVSEVSGRGVGISSIKEEVKKLGGKIYFNAAVGVGTRLRVVIPHFFVNPKKNADNVDLKIA